MKKKLDTGLKMVQKLGINPAKSLNQIRSDVEKLFPNRKEAGEYLQRTFSHEDDESMYPDKNSTYETGMTITGDTDADLIRRTANWMEKRAEYFGKEILEVGCDCGLMSCVLAMMFPESHITAIDRRPEGIAIAGQLAGKLGLENITFLQTELKDLEGCYDTVLDMRCISENFGDTEKDPNLRYRFFYDQADQYYVPAIYEYVRCLCDHVSDAGTLVSIPNTEVNPLLAAYMYCVQKDGLALVPEAVGKIRYLQLGQERMLVGLVARADLEVDDSLVLPLFESLFDYDGTGASYKDWLADLLMQNSREDLIAGFYVMKGEEIRAKYALYTIRDDETALMFFQKDSSRAMATRHPIEEKENSIDLLEQEKERWRLQNFTVRDIIYQPMRRMEVPAEE